MIPTTQKETSNGIPYASCGLFGEFNVALFVLCVWISSTFSEPEATYQTICSPTALWLVFDCVEHHAAFPYSEQFAA
jgi:hypothetical protein